jgi:hypothetical protein
MLELEMKYNDLVYVNGRDSLIMRDSVSEVPGVLRGKLEKLRYLKYQIAK